LEKETHIWNQRFISYKIVSISITFEKVVEILYCVNLIIIIIIILYCVNLIIIIIIIK